MANQIDIQKFVELRKRELGPENEEIIQKIEMSSQSIYRWLQYCQYHHFNLVSSTEHADLMLDRISQYRRKGENVIIRHVYEANIVAFLNSLHAVLDSFPYLLNLFIPVYDNQDSIENGVGDLLKSIKATILGIICGTLCSTQPLTR